MRIKEIKIKNFRGIAHLFTPLEKINVIVGKNASGKTSFLNAIRTAVLGKPPADAIKLQEVEGFVEIDIDKLGKVRRVFPEAKSLLNGKATTQKAVSETFKEVFVFSAESAKIATSSEIFGGLASEDVSKYLLNEGFINAEADVETISALCGLSKQAEDELRKALPSGKADPSSIDELYKEFYSRRTGLRKLLKEMEAKAKFDGTPPARTYEEVSKEYASVLKELAEIAAERSQYDTALKAFENHQKSLEEARGQAAAIECTEPDMALAEKAKVKIETINKCLVDYSSALSTLDANIKMFTKVYESLNTDKCPISDNLKCNTDKTSVMGEVAQALENTKAEYEALLAKYNETETRKKASDEWMRKFEQNAALFNQKTLKLQVVETLEKADIKKPEELSEVNIVALEARKQELYAEQEAVMKYSQSLEAAESAKNTKASLAACEEIVEATNPKKGIRQLMIEGSVKPLQDYLNEKSSILLPGKKIIIDTSNGFDVRVGDEKESISYSSASASEQARIALILCDMFSELSGIRILMIDNLDKFDKDTLELVAEFIQGEGARRYDSIFLAGVDNPDVMEVVEKIPGAFKINL